jgi:diacylglycerol kinase (ATP)
VWLETTAEDPGAGQTRAALERGVDLVLVCGGDGTVAQCAAVLAGTGTPMALVPFGTGNLLIRNLRLPLELAEALDVAAGSRRDRIDILETGDTRFTVMAGLGLDAAMMRDTHESAKKRFGWIAYVAGGARALRRSKPTMYTVQIESQKVLRMSALAVLIANVGQLQGGMAVLPEADPRDGLLDVIVVTARSWRDIPALLVRLVGHRLGGSPRVHSLTGRTVTVRSDEPVPVEFDGDYAGEFAELTVTVLPSAVVLCVP